MKIELFEIRHRLREKWKEKLIKEKIQKQLKLYIPAMLGYTDKENDKRCQDGLNELKNFLKSDKKLMLLLGDSGSGKTLFGQWLVNHLWVNGNRDEGDDNDDNNNNATEEDEIIPIFIHLPTIKDLDNFISEYFKKLKLTREQIKALKKNGKLFFVLDAYDEMDKENFQGNNLHRLGKLYKWKQAKVLITCRSEALVKYSQKKFKAVFTPLKLEEDDNKYTKVVQESPDSWEKRYVLPFNKQQIPAYIQRWLESRTDEENEEEEEKETDYLHILNSIPHVTEMIKNPFILWVVMKTLPSLLKEEFKVEDLQKLRVTRLELFKKFTKEWFKRQKRKLLNNNLIKDDWAADIVEDFKLYCEQLANRMWQMHRDSVLYNPPSSRKSLLSSSSNPDDDWDAFFDPNGYFDGDKNKPLNIVRQGALLRITEGNNYSFLHNILLEYFSSSNAFNNAIHQITIPMGLEINSQLIVNDPARIRLGVDCVNTNPNFTNALWEIIYESRYYRSVEVAAANAITILTAANKSFAGCDLRRIRIPNANVAGANFEGADLEGADLRKVNISQAWLNNTNLSGCFLDELQTGELYGECYESEVLDCKFSQDGKIYGVLTIAQLIIYDTSTHKQLTKILSKHFGLMFLCFSFIPENNDMLLGTFSGVILRKSFKNRKDNMSWYGSKLIVSTIAITPDSQLAYSASASGADIYRWNVSTGECIESVKIHRSTITSIAISPNNQWALIGYFDQKIILWKFDTNEHIKIHKKRTFDFRLSLAISPNSQWILIGGPFFILRRDLDTNWAITWIKETEEITALKISPDGRFAFSSTYDGQIKCWDVNTGLYIKTLGGHSLPTRSLAIMPNGTLGLSGSSDKKLKRWNLATVRSLASTSKIHTDIVTSVKITPDGESVFSCSWDNTIQSWNVTTGKYITNLGEHSEPVTTLALSPNNQWAFSGSLDKTIKHWDITTGKCIATWEGHDDSISVVLISPDSQWALSGSKDGSIKRWNITTSKCTATWYGHSSSIKSIVISHDAQWAFSGSLDKTIKQWDIVRNKCIGTWEGHKEAVLDLVITPDKQWIFSGSSDKTIRQWNVATGKCIDTNEIFTNGFHHSLLLSPDGRWLLTGGINDCLILWPITKGRNFKKYIFKHQFMTGIFSICWSKVNPNFVVLGMSDGSISGWYINPEDALFQLKWRTKPWGLQVQNCKMLGVHGLSESDERTLKEKGASVQVSRKLSKKIIAHEGEIDILYDETLHGKSQFDKTMNLNPNLWVVSIVRKKSGRGEKHAKLVLESVEQGYYRIREIDFFIDLRYKNNAPNCIHRGDSFGKAYVQILNLSLSTTTKLASDSCFRSSGITTKQGLQFIKNIRAEQEKCLAYSLPGSGNVYRLFKPIEAEAQHNCMSWCEEQLEKIGVKNLTEKSWKDNIVNNPKRKLKDGNQLKKSPRFKFKDNSTQHDRKDPNSKCILM